VFYTTVGHNPYVFWDADFLKHFLAAIQFALGDLEVDTTPNAPMSEAGQ
jgi:type 1 glutamine amidotransferase